MYCNFLKVHGYYSHFLNIVGCVYTW